jgi:diketogulonate reductase-like aldo/keto reductase
MEHPALVSAATAHGRTAAQVLGRWAIQKGLIYIPKSEKPERARSA